MTITPLLSFRGDCADAFRLYERAFGATIVTMLTYAAAQQDTVPPGWRGKIFHATLAVGGHELSGGDPLPELGARPEVDLESVREPGVRDTFRGRVCRDSSASQA